MNGQASQNHLRSGNAQDVEQNTKFVLPSMKNQVIFEPAARAGLYRVTVNNESIPLLLAEHHVVKTLELLKPFSDWEKEENKYFNLLVAGACMIAMKNKDGNYSSAIPPQERISNL